MKFTKKILSLLLALTMVLTLLPATAFATEGEKLTLEELRAQYGAITFEAYNIGYGFVVEPTLYEKEAELTTASITMSVLESKGLEYLGSDSYMSGITFDDTFEAVYPDYIDVDMWGLSTTGDGNGFLTEFDYGYMSGWVHTIDDWFASYGIDTSGPGVELNDYNTGEPMVLGDVIRWHFSAAGWGADVGFPSNAMAEDMGGNLFTQEDKTELIFMLAAINDYYGNLDTDTTYETALAVAADPLATADEIAAQEAALTSYIEETFLSASEPEQPRQPQSVTSVLNATMAQLAATVTAPTFASTGGDWVVFDLARGGYYAKDNKYFTDYYARIVEYVNTTAATVNLNGALDKTKSTENARLIVALAAIGKDATAVGNWDLTAPYNDFTWIKKQGMNGPIWALIALDSNDYETTATDADGKSIRQQCVDYLLSQQHDDGGWSMAPSLALTSNVDITGMVLTALAPYQNQSEVAAACEEAIAWLSEAQLSSGGFPYGSDGETSESCAWAIVALTALGINPDTDSRFVKDGNSAIDNLLSYYVEADRMFAHQGQLSDAMGTEQATYALIAYDRLITEGKTALFDFSDVTFDVSTVVPGKPKAYLHLPAEVTNDPGTTFSASVTIDQWDYEAGWKLLDMVMTVPAGITVTSVTPSRLSGGNMSFNLETMSDGSGKLRAVYFDSDANATISIAENTVTNTDFPAEMFTVEFEVVSAPEAETELSFAITGMSLKKSSDSVDPDAMLAVNTDGAIAVVEVVEGVSYSAVCLYTGDGIDLIPTTKKAVAVFVTGLESPAELSYDDGTNEYDLIYSEEMTVNDIYAYVVMVDAAIEMTSFVDKEHYQLDKDAEPAAEITFGDANGDATINAEDALAAVNAWLRKTEVTTDTQILTLNVNGDARINTFDALGIVEHFVSTVGNYGVVTKALTAEPATANANN